MWSGRSSFTSLVVGVFVVYVVHTCWVMYGIVYTRPCSGHGRCIQPYLAQRPKLQLSVYTTTRSNLGAENNVDLVLNVEDFDVESKFERTVNVSVPKKTRNNGTLYAYVFLHHAGILPWNDGKQVHVVSPLTTYMVPKPEEVNLLTGGPAAQQQIEAEKRPSALDEPVSHWRPRLTLNVMVDDFVFDGASLPADVQRYMKMIQLGKTVQYLPILFIDQLSSRVKDLMVINRSSTELPLTVSYDKISLGRLRFWIHMQDAVYSLQQFGFSEKDADEVKGIFVDTNLYFLALTFFVAAFHLLFDFLAFKNDISFWKKKKSMIGMSTKAGSGSGLARVLRAAPQGPAGGPQAYSDALRGLCPGPPQRLLGTGFWVPEGAAWEGEGSLLAVVSTPCAWGRGQGGRFSTLVCMGSWSCGPPGWPPSRRWLFSSRGVTLREGPGVLGWPRVQVPRLGVFCPPSLASLRGGVSCPHLWLPWGEGRTEPPAFHWPLPRWREQGLWGPGPALSAGSALQGASPQPLWLLSLRWEDRHGSGAGSPSGAVFPASRPCVVPVSVAHTRPG
ncbi:lipid scramblase CLPTM1L isoform X1 [Ovis aries]|uniref:lipid scramblase CLPTM1L isoform X1 n=1 Tax=Ovis aries TaxID=9940 RepID=UPI001C2EA49C|nr:lipid scramblase CLPTM1L isoform X1 [Ovis aries]